jgi:hypothetical protein
MRTYPKVKGVQALPGKRLRVIFENDEVRVYDCTPLLDEPLFQPLREDGFFRSVSADRHGYGVIWSDEVDLAESELWLHGTPEQAAAVGPR